MTSRACCKVTGQRYRWDAAAGCRTEVAATNGTHLCAEMTYDAPDDGGDYCTYLAAQSCHQRPDGAFLDVIVATSYWKPAELGPGWQECASGLQEQVSAAPVCP
ncbi:MAG: hypothetical protein MUF64_00695 [Polyangiaceae bacterium]|nr:hypothetical protein [Polyangiaceae bacterium]